MTITIQSFTSDRTYTIRQARDGAFTCTCRAWRFQRVPGNRRVCKHLRYVQAELLGHIANAAR